MADFIQFNAMTLYCEDTILTNFLESAEQIIYVSHNTVCKMHSLITHSFTHYALTHSLHTYSSYTHSPTHSICNYSDHLLTHLYHTS